MYQSTHQIPRVLEQPTSVRTETRDLKIKLKKQYFLSDKVLINSMIICFLNFKNLIKLIKFQNVKIKNLLSTVKYDSE